MFLRFLVIVECLLFPLPGRGLGLDGSHRLLRGQLRLVQDGPVLIRPSGTEPVLRVYAEAPTEQSVRALLDYGEEVAAST